MKKSILATILIAGTLFVNSSTASAATVVYLDGTVTQLPDSLVIGNPNFTQNFDGTYSSTYELTAGKPSVGTLDPATAAKYLPGYSNTTSQPVETPVQPVETPASKPVETPASQPVEVATTNTQNTTPSSSVETTPSSSVTKVETKTEVKTESSKPSSIQIPTKKVENLPKTNDSSIFVPVLGTLGLAFSTLVYSLKKNK